MALTNQDVVDVDSSRGRPGAAGGDVDGGDPDRDHPVAVGVVQRSGDGNAGKAIFAIFQLVLIPELIRKSS